MFARSTTFQAEPSRLDDGIAYVRDEVMPAVTATPGCAGLSLLVDRSSGRCIVTSSWHDEASLQDSEERVQALRDRGAQLFGTTPRVDVWEIALLHRVQDAPEGACVRVSWTRGDPARAEEMIDMFRARAISVMESLPGFCSASLFVNRDTGRAVTSATYDSRASLERSQGGASQLRSAIVQEGGLELEDIAEFDLLLAHLRVPETV